MSEPEILPERTRSELRQWAEGARCHLMVLFGSAASPGSSAPRDVDIAVSFAAMPTPEDRLGIIGEIQEIVRQPRAEVVFLRAQTDPVLRFEIFRGGVPLHEAEHGAFAREAVRALALYEDSLPFRRALRNDLRRRALPA